MKLRYKLLYSALGAGALLMIGAIAAPKLHAAVKAALVEVVIPSKPFFTELSVTGSAASSDGPDTGQFGVTSLTFTNYDAAPQQVFVFAPIFSNGSVTNCSSSSVIGGGGPQLNVMVPAKGTLHVAYPTPLVFSTVFGHTCIAAEITTNHTNGVTVGVNGFVN